MPPQSSYHRGFAAVSAVLLLACTGSAGIQEDAGAGVLASGARSSSSGDKGLGRLSDAGVLIAPSMCGVDGCPGDGCSPNNGRACRMADGCPGTYDCDGICQYNSSGSRSCSACGQTGAQSCGSGGPYGPCNVQGMWQACTMPDGCSGAQMCNTVPGGTWGACGYNATGSRSCSACGQSGTQACGSSGPYGACNVAVLQQSCTQGCGVGTQACNNVPGGSWGACGGCTTASCQTTASALCGTSGTIACTSSCAVATGATCVVHEAPNNCDDDGNGQIDEGIFQTACDL